MYMYNQDVYNKLDIIANIVNSSKQSDKREFLLTVIQVCKLEIFLI